ncbi:MAG TPA: hypothetical protein ENG06_00185 [Thermoplasmatales archaeon]|nr:MAG: hypothetical protein DRN07_06725 [Thermoplasmata archaeon]HDN50175.1 hypothetical protein [Thermoplasmatales archaeon]
MADEQKLREKIEDLNEMRALVKRDLEKLEEKKHSLKPEKYERLKGKYERRIDKIRHKIKQLEDQLHHH